MNKTKEPSLREWLTVGHTYLKPLTCTEISKKLSVSTAAITSIKDYLLSQNYVIEVTSPDDRRKKAYVATDLGREMFSHWLAELQALKSV